jgi:ribosomal peptide maturation radical SAM protein 1
MRRIAFINPPFASVYRPSIALTQLRHVAEREPGLGADIGYLNLAVAGLVGVESYEEIANRHYMQGFGDWLFRSLAFPDIADNEDEYFARMYPGAEAGAPDGAAAALARHAGQARRLARLRPQIYAAIERYVDEHDLAGYDLVGLTSLFSQNMACFALARLVKERNPGVTVIMGGANCEDPMGAAIRTSVKWVDYVFSGPAISSFREFLLRWREGDAAALAQPVAGVFARDDERQRTLIPMAADPAPPHRVGARNDIDEPIALDYDGYLDQFDQHFPGSEVRPTLLFETSRGCWWGERSQCTFCGLNGTGMEYDAMSPERAVAHISDLFRYQGRVHVLSGVDNILPRSFITHVLPRLRTPADMSLFFEVKVGLTGDHMRTMAQAGVRDIQPGIESLATSTLRLMRKGTTAFQNVMFLRDARAAGLRPDWLILAGFPGEQEAVYAKYLHDLPLLTHLQPPMGVIGVRFDRFSAYFEDPGQYGLDLRPMRFYELIYPFSPGVLRDLAYYFYDVTPDPEYQRTFERYLPQLRALVMRWQQRWRAGQPPGLRFVTEGRGPDGAVVMDTRAGAPAFRTVSPAGVALLEALRRPLTLAKAAERCGLDEDRATGELLQLQADGLIFTERGKHLSLVTA